MNSLLKILIKTTDVVFKIIKVAKETVVIINGILVRRVFNANSHPKILIKTMDVVSMLLKTTDKRAIVVVPVCVDVSPDTIVNSNPVIKTTIMVGAPSNIKVKRVIDAMIKCMAVVGV